VTARAADRADARLALLLVLPAAALLLLFVYAPIVDTVRLSFHRSITTLPSIGEPWVGVENYERLLSSPVFRGSLARTAVFVFASTAIEVVLGLGMALSLHAAYRGRGWVRAAALVPWAVPTVVAAQMWRFLWNDRFGPISYWAFGGMTPLAGADSALAAVIAADVWKSTSFAALIIQAGLQQIPDELHEAAEVDGAGPVRRFFRVTLPLLRPAILAALLFRTIDAFRVFDLVFVMTQGGPADGTDVLPYFAYKRTFAEGFVGSGSAASTVVFLASFAVALVYLRVVGSSLWRKAT
jgi:multiple sugar transport system permease protein